MKPLKRFLIFILIAVIFTVIFKYAYLNLQELLTYLSPRHEVKPHFIEKVKSELNVFYSITIIITFVFIILLPYLKKHFLLYSKFKSVIKINSSLIKKIGVVVLGIYIFAAPLFVLYSLDISTDESTYAYTGLHYYNFNKFMIKFDNDNYQIPKDMFLQNIPIVILKQFTSYSIQLMRFISYFYSMLFVIVLFSFFWKESPYRSASIFLITIASYSGFIFLSGTSFGENSALLFSLSAIYLFGRYYDTKKLVGLHLPALLIALSVITKIQLGIFIIPALVIITIIYYIKGKRYKHTLSLITETVAFSMIIVAVFWFFSYNVKEIKSLAAFYYSVSVNSITYAENSGSILMNIERFFNYHMLIFLPVVFYYFYDKKYEKSFPEKYFFLVFIMNALWFITMKGYNFRFMYFAQIGIILLSVKPISLIYEQCSKSVRNTINLLFILLLVVGLLQNIKLTVNGVSNDYLFFLNGNNPLKTFYKYNRNNDQKEFYDNVKKVLDVNEPVYYVGAEFEVMAFIPNKFYTFDIITYNPDLQIKYIIRTSINDQLDINLSANEFLKNRCDKVFEKGLYSLYKIK